MYRLLPLVVLFAFTATVIAQQATTSSTRFRDYRKLEVGESTSLDGATRNIVYLDIEVAGLGELGGCSVNVREMTRAPNGEIWSSGNSMQMSLDAWVKLAEVIEEIEERHRR